MRHVDQFILFDDVQFTKRDWRSRNRIKTATGPMWLTIPVRVKGRYKQAVRDVCVADPTWNRDHWRTIQTHYTRAPFYGQFKDVLEDLFLGCSDLALSRVNYRFICGLRDILDITTKLSWSMDYVTIPGRTERLVSLCEQAHATEYVSGPSARDYIEAEQFERAGIKLTFFNYSGYPEYPQIHPPFDHFVTVIDLILHTGFEAKAYMLPVSNDQEVKRA
jgi:hypothetical protein